MQLPSNYRKSAPVRTPVHFLATSEVILRYVIPIRQYGWVTYPAELDPIFPYFWSHQGILHFWYCVATSSGEYNPEEPSPWPPPFITSALYKYDYRSHCVVKSEAAEQNVLMVQIWITCLILRKKKPTVQKHGSVKLFLPCPNLLKVKRLPHFREKLSFACQHIANRSEWEKSSLIHRSNAQC